MKYMFFSMLLGAGLALYFTSGAGKNAFAGLPSIKMENFLPAKTAGPAEDGSEPTKHMVQIEGKWYPYRADNTYMIDGVPTLHIAKKPVATKAPSENSATPTADSKPNTNLEKSQRLAKMAGENPLSVYTPEGFKALKDGLEAATKSASERKQALEALSQDQ